MGYARSLCPSGSCALTLALLIVIVVLGAIGWPRLAVAGFIY